ncbi:unnamed protein product [Adineta steineri]|uniref:Uncharacterized protein n=1 Tax=Adineta steineri TaxID=433720 RepID=A0A814GJ24_9BILA|nr:unnamed protein product [Adineta steineri]CAF1066666.1 unnamed protein product [Adineta steineri]CAF1221640.1 unnamed protein product [Adineta steineri]
MDNEADWVYVEKQNELIDELEVISIGTESEENVPIENKPSYAAALLKNIQPNDQQQQQQQRQRIVSSIEPKKCKSMSKPNGRENSLVSYIESKPGSQYRNPRDKAGKNKVHNGRQQSTSPLRSNDHSMKTDCSYSNPKLSNLIERTRNMRQQCSTVTWKDCDY